jgi:hypothetical protein
MKLPGCVFEQAFVGILGSGRGGAGEESMKEQRGRRLKSLLAVVLRNTANGWRMAATSDRVP